MAFALPAHEPAMSRAERRSLHESRAGVLRLAIALILLINLWAGEAHGNFILHLQVIAAYALATTLALGFVFVWQSPRWLGYIFIAVDALLVLTLFHEHLFGEAGPNLDHTLTIPSIAVAFLLLTHAALWLRPKLVAVFAILVLGGWLALAAALALNVVGHHSGDTAPLASEVITTLAPDLALALAFAFAAFLLYLLTSDHVGLVKAAVANERRRANLSRFFAPSVAAELEAQGDTLGLRRQPAGVMFVDLRGFTGFAEDAPAAELAATLSEYRHIVSETVFAWGGTVDKFIGDGVLAVFGIPRTAPDDAAKAFGCARAIAEELAAWSRDRESQGRPPLPAGIGLHYGPVVSGVLSSGCHDEFTVLGDTVNVAERLEGCSKTFNARIVASDAIVRKLGRRSAHELVGWEKVLDVELPGRSGVLGIAILPRA